ncbi:tRNA (adenosine(37)-N6)-dimethylallyltransferase MiaA [Candidatus Gracilibacteria bacterium]|nr:tRNA (adenosine(37)-N6)-dimethylallyltransferase MiaA [Candidatus Gracilibacteria bacterium]MCF7896804.1 tRNA (adenosine(37)-N6)-dimethylallyltransferase MiaA [Candidatus Gracilibacteria bacterium]
MKIQTAKKLVSKWLGKKPRRPLLIVVGPTASGKTGFAIHLAKTFGGEIVNADSRQIYRELEIGSAPPTATERTEVPHYLVGIASPAEKISVAKYRKLAEAKIREILRRGKLPILTGGHTLLISAIVENFQFPGKADENRRAELGKIWEKNPAKLWKMLQKIDSETAAKIPAKNRHHLIRAVERAELGGESKKGRRKFDCLILGLNPNREKLYEQINQRVERMLKSGLLTEVEQLGKKYNRFAPALRGHGYRELLDFLASEKSWEVAVAEIKKDTRNYAKRQMTWWRNCGFAKEIIWL